MKRLALFAMSALTAALGAGLLAGPAVAAPTGNMLKNIDYYTVNKGSTFCRWTTPQSDVPLDGGGTASQSRNGGGNGPVTLSFSQAPSGYADNGFYEAVGNLANLDGYTITGTAPFGDNLWLDTNGDSEFFTWGTSGCLTGLGGDVSAFGPTSTPTSTGQQSVTVNGSTEFSGLPCGTATLDELKAGDCAGVDPNTNAAVWIGTGTFLGSNLSLSTRIISASLATG